MPAPQRAPRTPSRVKAALEPSLTVEDVMGLLKVGRSHVNKLVRTQQLRSYRDGALRRFTPEAVREYRERQERGS